MRLLQLFIAIALLSDRAHAGLPFVEVVALGSAGYSVAKNTDLDLNQSLGQFSAGIFAGYEIAGTVAIGGISEYRAINQYRTSAGGSNLSGTRFVLVSPAVFVDFGRLRLSLDVQLMGDLRLSKQTSRGKDLAYTSPIGGRGMVYWEIFSGIFVGAFYEKVRFRSYSLSGAKPVDLTSTLDVTNFGLGLAVSIL